MTTRRSFIGGLVAAAAAPALVRSESLMKLWVPPQDIILPHVGWDIGSKEFTAEAWYRPAPDGAFRLVGIIQGDGIRSTRVDGREDSNDHPLVAQVIRPVVESADLSFSRLPSGAQVDEFRITKGEMRVFTPPTHPYPA